MITRYRSFPIENIDIESEELKQEVERYRDNPGIISGGYRILFIGKHPDTGRLLVYSKLGEAVYHTGIGTISVVWEGRGFYSCDVKSFLDGISKAIKFFNGEDYCEQFTCSNQNVNRSDP
jgi:hypothetical protein